MRDFFFGDYHFLGGIKEDNGVREDFFFLIMDNDRRSQTKVGGGEEGGGSAGAKKKSFASQCVYFTAIGRIMP